MHGEKYFFDIPDPGMIGCIDPMQPTKVLDIRAAARYSAAQIYISHKK
jgi:hypothetical protein